MNNQVILSFYTTLPTRIPPSTNPLSWTRHRPPPHRPSAAQGITVASCDVTEVAPAEEEGIDVQMTSCGDPGALRLSWETETSVALSTATWAEGREG